MFELFLEDKFLEIGGSVLLKGGFKGVFKVRGFVVVEVLVGLGKVYKLIFKGVLKVVFCGLLKGNLKEKGVVV